MLLAKDGIFPITADQKGHPLPVLPASGLNQPGTIQGEGKLCGIPSLFIRMAGCNLHCCWRFPDGRVSPCDTSYASYRLRDTRECSVTDICKTISHNCHAIRHLVITGGEPFLQAEELKILCMKLKQSGDFHITVETNATLFDPEVAAYIDLFSLSPKLSSSQPINARKNYLQPSVIQDFIHYARQNARDFQLKFVYASPEDVTEIRQLLAILKDWKKEDILLMPAGGTPELQAQNRHSTLTICIENGWRYCERLHLNLFGDKAGV